MKKNQYCDNPTCEALAVVTLPASTNKASDTKRHYCACCLEAYCVGMQHARFTIEAARAKEQAKLDRYSAKHEHNCICVGCGNEHLTAND